MLVQWTVPEGDESSVSLETLEATFGSTTGECTHYVTGVRGTGNVQRGRLPGMARAERDRV